MEICDTLDTQLYNSRWEKLHREEYFSDQNICFLKEPANPPLGMIIKLISKLLCLVLVDDEER